MDDVYLKLGISHIQEKRFPEALEYLSKAEEFNSNNGAIYYYIGNCYYYQDKLDEALQFYEKAITFGEKLEDCYRKKAMIFQKNGNNHDALLMLDEVLKINPNNYYAYYVKGKILHTEKKYKEAIEMFRTALQCNPTFKEGKEGLVLSIAGLNQRTNAFEHLKVLFKEDMAKPELLAFKARLHKEFGEYMNAMESINAALKLKPEEPIFQGDKIVYLYYLNNFDECIKEGSEIIEKRQNTSAGLKGFYSLLYYVGCSYLRKKDPEKANSYFQVYEEKVKEGNWKDEYLIEKARIMLDIDKDNVLVYIEKVLKANPKSVEALKFKLNYYELHDQEYKDEIQELKQKIEELDVKKEKEEYCVMYDEMTQSCVVQSVMVSSQDNCSPNIMLQNQGHGSFESSIIQSGQSTEQSSTSEDCDLKMLGKGSFGKVYQAKMYNGKDIALKKGNSKVKAIDDKEREILKSIDHPNVVKYLGFFMDDILLELCKGQDLYTLVITLKVELPKKFKYKIMRQIAEALKYLHIEKGIIHGDLKSKNILLDKQFEFSQKEVNDFPNAKLCDFGLSRKTTDVVDSTGYSPVYAAPELLDNGAPTFMSDIYSFGITLYELFSGEVPYTGLVKSKEDLFNMIKRAVYPLLEKIPGCPKELAELQKNCCKRKPEERYSIDDILKQIIAIQSSDL